MTTTLEDTLYRSLAALVVKEELALAEHDAFRDRNYLPARRCSCESLASGPGCRACLVKRARRVMAEYEASKSPEIPDSPTCADCGGPAETDVVFRFTDDGSEVVCARCVAAIAERAREMSAVGL